MKYNIIFIVLLVSCIFNTSCTHNKLTNKETEYKELTDSLRKAWTLSICYKVYRADTTCTYCRYDGLKQWNKNMEDYKNDSTALSQAILSIYSKDSNYIKYLKSFKKSRRDFPNYEHFTKRNIPMESDHWNVWKISKFYSPRNNAYLNLILNYYLNTEQKSIKLLLFVDYITDNKILTEDLYERLDKIFEKYGYEDKEKIREAILEDFGACIILEGM